MKNIHLSPTKKGKGRLFIESVNNDLIIRAKNSMMVFNDCKYYHQYITSNEEIKEGDWVLSFLEDESYGMPLEIEENHFNCGFDFEEDFKKIILTTDQNLIADGVQAIEDEFLEWFVENRTCEWIEVIKIDVEQPKPLYPNGNHKGERVWIEQYKIIIPKEKPKQTVEQYEQKGLEKHSYELKQETLEEAISVKRTELFSSILSIVKKIPRENTEDDAMDAVSCSVELELLFNKYQAERMYSEEEVLDLLPKFAAYTLINADENSRLSIKEWFEQFKKK